MSIVKLPAPSNNIIVNLHITQNIELISLSAGMLSIYEVYCHVAFQMTITAGHFRGWKT